MKSRSRKLRLQHCYAQVTKQAVKIVNVVVEETKSSRNPFEMLFKEIKPLEEVTEDPPEEKKTRGRPRRWFPESPDDAWKHKHRMDDAGACVKSLPTNVRLSMIADFNYHYSVNKIPLKQSLERIMKQYSITYKQAHQVLEKEF